MKKVLTIAGSDCSGGAGLQADLKTMCAHGVFGMSAVVSVVAENTARVLDIQNITPQMIAQQIDAIYEDIVPDAVKIGMLSAPECMRAVEQKIKQYRMRNIVIDPVMFAKNGDALMESASVGALREHILPYADVLTPNLHEAECITGHAINTPEQMEAAAKEILELGCHSVLLKGGRAMEHAVDVYCDGQICKRLESRRIDTRNTHGTGCTLSSAIASNLALGYPMLEAVIRAKDYVTDAIAHALPIGQGNGPLNHFCRIFPDGQIDTGTAQA